MTMELDLEIIRKLIELAKEMDLLELEIKEGDVSVKIVRNTISTPKASQIRDVEKENQPKVELVRVLEEEKRGYHPIKSPLVGVFYRRPSPNEPPYVEVGDHVEKGQTLCIVEAMKVMNEITSDLSGRIVEIPVKDGSPVEFGQVLFWIEPD